MIDLLKLIYGDKEAKPPRPPAKRNAFHDPDPDGDLKPFLLLDPKELIDAANHLYNEAAKWRAAWRDQWEATGNNYWNGYNHFAELTRKFLIGTENDGEHTLDLLTEMGQMTQLPNNAGWVMSSETRNKLIAAGWELVKRSNVMNRPKDGYDMDTLKSG